MKIYFIKKIFYKKKIIKNKIFIFFSKKKNKFYVKKNIFLKKIL
jgi:hypothetical protein